MEKPTPVPTTEKKAPKPSLAGRRTKTRKRQVHIPLDTRKFAMDVIPCLAEVEFQKAMDELDKKQTVQWQRYGDQLWDLIIAGGMVAPGGELPDNHDERNPNSVFAADGPEEVDVLVGSSLQVLQRRPFLRPKLEDEINRLVLFIGSYSDKQRSNLARFLGTYFAKSNPSPVLFVARLKHHDRLVASGQAFEFVMMFCTAFLKTGKMEKLMSLLRMANLEDAMDELLPPKQRHLAALTEELKKNNLDDMATFYQQKTLKTKINEVNERLEELLNHPDAKPSDMAKMLATQKHQIGLTDVEVCKLAFEGLLNNLQWSKKVEQHQNQLLNQLKNYCAILSPFCQTMAAEIALLNRIQLYCYEKSHLARAFLPCIQIMYQADIIGEDAILAWHKGDKVAVQQKGREDFVTQMQPFVTWLQEADEEDDDEDED